MPLILLFIGVALVWAGVRDTQNQLFGLIQSDVFTTSDKSFWAWVLAIVIVGAVGYIPKMKPLSNSFLVLLVVVLFLSNGGFFAKFQEQIGITGPQP